MGIELTYSVQRIYQHQSGATFAVVQMSFLDNTIEASFPLQNLEGRVQAYVRDWLSAGAIKNVKTTIEI